MSTRAAGIWQINARSLELRMGDQTSTCYNNLLSPLFVSHRAMVSTLQTVSLHDVSRVVAWLQVCPRRKHAATFLQSTRELPGIKLHATREHSTLPYTKSNFFLTQSCRLYDFHVRVPCTILIAEARRKESNQNQPANHFPQRSIHRTSPSYQHLSKTFEKNGRFPSARPDFAPPHS